MNISRSFFFILLVSAVWLSGCANPHQPLYSWGPYQSQVYAYFNGESPEEQIQVLEKHAQVTQAAGKALPPGYKAHMGLLYGKVGRDAEFVAALEEERLHFPESAPYIDSLLNQSKRGGAKQ